MQLFFRSHIVFFALFLLVACGTGGAKKINEKKLSDSLAANRAKLPPPATMHEDVADNLCHCFTPIIRFTMENEDVFKSLDSGNIGLNDAGRIMKLQAEVMVIAKKMETCVDSINNQFGINLDDTAQTRPIYQAMRTRCPEIEEQAQKLGLNKINFQFAKP